MLLGVRAYSVVRLQLLFIGGFNISVDSTTCPLAAEFLPLLQSFDISHHVHSSPH